MTLLAPELGLKMGDFGVRTRLIGDLDSGRPLGRQTAPAG